MASRVGSLPPVPTESEHYGGIRIGGDAPRESGELVREAMVVGGHRFACVENAYISFGFSCPWCGEVQRQLAQCNNGFMAKKRVKSANRHLLRPDWEEGCWRFEAMMYLWGIRLEQHPEFRALLLSIPRSVHIIENGEKGRKKDGVWGMIPPEQPEKTPHQHFSINKRKGTNMTTDTNASETAAAYIPSAEEWGRMHRDWFSKLVDLLKWYHCKHDREDAVQEAFFRLMPGRKDGIKAIPRTSNEWFFKILGEARGILSHENRRMKRFVYASQNADEDGMNSNPIESIPDERSQAAFDAMDTDILVMAARDTFNEICSKAGVSDTNKEAYWRRYLDGEDTQSVTRDLGIKSNNLYQIGNRIGRLISSSSAKDIFEKRLADLASQGLAA